MIVVGAGTCGCRLAPYVGKALGASRVVMVDTPDGIQSGESRAEKLGLKVSRVEVAYGSPTGAHRDYDGALKEAEKSKALGALRKQFVKAAKKAYKADRVPVIVWGLGGATGAATAIKLGEEVPYACHVTILPNYKADTEPIRKILDNAIKQLRTLMNRLEHHTVVTGDFAGVPVDKIGEEYAHALANRRDIVDKATAQNANYVRKGDRKVRMVFLVNGAELQRVQMGRLLRQLEELREGAEDFESADLAGSIQALDAGEDVDLTIEAKDEDGKGDDWKDFFL